MNEDIKALIEREYIERRFEISQKGIEYFNEKKGIHNVVGVDPAWLSVFNDAYEIGHKDALSLFKWRKVEEEMPEIGFRVLIKNEFNVVFMGYIDTVGEWRYCLNNTVIRFKPTEWMPIPNIED